MGSDGLEEGSGVGEVRRRRRRFVWRRFRSREKNMGAGRLSTSELGSRWDQILDFDKLGFWMD